MAALCATILNHAGLAAAFEMLCGRMGKLGEMAEHWLRREREKEWMQDGQVDSHLLALPLTVSVRRGGNHPIRPLTPLWRTVNIAFDHSSSPAEVVEGGTQCRLPTTRVGQPRTWRPSFGA
jgi:hypothetical protein